MPRLHPALEAELVKRSREWGTVNEEQLKAVRGRGRPDLKWFGTWPAGASPPTHVHPACAAFCTSTRGDGIK